MARLPRLTVPGLPHHVLQRGNNRQPIVVDDTDRQTLLALLAEHAKACEVAIHAYVLMDNHFHLLATPRTEDGLPRMMQAVGRRYVRHFNDRHGRSGTLWEGRYRSTLLQAERHLLDCMVHLDLHPVRAGLCAEPREHAWGSHGHCIGQRNDALVTPHALYWTLGNTPFAREAAYAQRVSAGLAPETRAALTDSVLSGWALGDPGFLAALQKRTPRRVAKAKAGRPTRAPGAASPG